MADQPTADRVARRALTASAALHDELLAAVRRRLRRLPATAPASDALDAARHALNDFTGPLASVLTDATLAAWLVGAGGVASLLPEGDFTPPSDAAGFDWDGSPAWLPLVRRAVAELRARELVTPERWEALSAEARARAFTAAGLATQEAAGSVRDALADVVEEGGGVREFREKIADALGESALSPARAENLFRTVSGRAYADAREALGQEPVVREVFPYRARIVTSDSRVTDLCATLARSGIEKTAIYRAEDRAWQHFRPLSHWQCRCSSRLLSVAEAAERGLASARRWLETGEDPRDFVPWPDVSLPRGWSPGGPTEPL